MKDGVMINAQAYHDTSLSNLLLTEKCSTGLSVRGVLSVIPLRGVAIGPAGLTVSLHYMIQVKPVTDSYPINV